MTTDDPRETCPSDPCDCPELPLQRLSPTSRPRQSARAGCPYAPCKSTCLRAAHSLRRALERRGSRRPPSRSSWRTTPGSWPSSSDAWAATRRPRRSSRRPSCAASRAATAPACATTSRPWRGSTGCSATRSSIARGAPRPSVAASPGWRRSPVTPPTRPPIPSSSRSSAPASAAWSRRSSRRTSARSERSSSARPACATSPRVKASLPATPPFASFAPARRSAAASSRAAAPARPTGATSASVSTSLPPAGREIE